MPSRVDTATDFEENYLTPALTNQYIGYSVTLTFTSFKSQMTPSSHLNFGLSLGLMSSTTNSPLSSLVVKRCQIRQREMKNLNKSAFSNMKFIYACNLTIIFHPTLTNLVPMAAVVALANEIYSQNL